MKFYIKHQFDVINLDYVFPEKIARILEHILPERVRFLLQRLLSTKEKVKYKVTSRDTWSADYTLAKIIYPTLLKFRYDLVNKYSCIAQVDPEDTFQVKEFKEKISYSTQYKGELKILERYKIVKVYPDYYYRTYNITQGNLDYAKWLWVIDEMIFAIRSYNIDYEDQFYNGEVDIHWKDLPNGYCEIIEGPNNTFKVDEKGLRKYEERIQNGLRLFGKYYRHLWL